MPGGKTHFVKGPCNNKQKVLQFPRFEGFISVEGGGLEGERKRLGWSLQNTPSSSPLSAKCCLQQFGPHRALPPVPAPSCCSTRAEPDVRHRCVSNTAPSPPSRAVHQAQPVQKSPGRGLCCPPCLPPRVPPQPAQAPRLGTASRHNFKGEIRVQGVGGCSDVNHAICASDGALHLLCEAVPAYLARCVCLSHLLTALHFQAVG